MDFEWTEEQVQFRSTVVGFAKEHLDAGAADRERRGVLPRELWKKCAEFGILGLPFPVEYGGLGEDILTAVLMMEGLGYGCRDGGLIFSINAQMWSVQMPIYRFGTEAQKRRYLAGLIRGDVIGAHGMTEPDSGSDAFSLRTTAHRRGDRYILNGTKMFVTNAPIADLFVVFATVDRDRGFLGVTAFILERGFSGLAVGKTIEKMGLRSSPMAELILDDCEVPVDNRLGKEGRGASIFNDSMEWERACILASYVGAMERQLEACVRYARGRRQFDQPIGKFQAVSHKIADMKMRLETSRLLLYRMAWEKKTRGEAPMAAALAKLYLSESWVASCLDAVQIHGGYGYTTEYEIERDLRDSVAGKLYSGTSEIQRNIIARGLGL